VTLPDDSDAVRFAYAHGYRPVGSYGFNPYYAAQAPQTLAVPVRTVQTVEATPVRQRTVSRQVDRAPRRDWQKTALVIGGSTATAAGIGGLVGGKKGALIGAAIGGGASTLYETTR
jgi:hypothetical protein